AAPAHLRDTHLADGGGGGGGRGGEGREDRTGCDIGDHKAPRHAIEPAVERLVEVLARGRRADRGAHHHEHRDRYQREVRETGIECLGRHVQRIHALKDHEERERDGAQPECNRRAGEQYDERGDKNDRALGGRTHAFSFGGSPNGHSRPVTNLMTSATYCRLRSANPTGIAAYGIHTRARHMDSERQLFSQASYQNWDVSTVMTAQNANDISMEA